MNKIFRKEVLVGVLVIVACLILFFGINFLKGINLFKAANYFYATYNNVQGLAISAPVTPFVLSLLKYFSLLQK